MPENRLAFFCLIVQYSPLIGSMDNVLIQIMVQIFASPILL